MRDVTRLLVFVVIAGACSASCALKMAPAPTPSQTTTTTQTATSTTASPSTADGVAWLHDDWSDALQKAKAEGKQLVVDVWAPWCHTCLSMQREVLHDAALRPLASGFVFLAVDADRVENAAFLARNPYNLLPTFLVVDPVEVRTLAAYEGSMSLVEFMAFVKSASMSNPLNEAHRARVHGELDKALTLYLDDVKLHASDAGVLGALLIYNALQQGAACVAFGKEHLHDVKGSGAQGDAAAAFVDCAGLLADEAARNEAYAFAAERLSSLVKNPSPGSSIDDRADVMGNLANLYVRDGKAAEARALHEQRLALLTNAAKQAGSPEEASVYDYQRMGSYLFLDRGDEAVALFTERGKQFPQSYEPWARLGFTELQMKRFDEAVPALRHAVDLSYGRRRLRYLSQLAEAEEGRNHKDEARAALEKLVRENEALPAALRQDAWAQDAQKKLTALK